MQLENSFEVSVPSEAAWKLLTDVPAVLPCMPGAELLEILDDDRWRARLQVRLGPISLQFMADLKREATDLSARRAVLRVDAREARGRGTAQATITSFVEDATGGSRVSILTDLALRGPLAQYGRVVMAPVADPLASTKAPVIPRDTRRRNRRRSMLTLPRGPGWPSPRCRPPRRTGGRSRGADQRVAAAPRRPLALTHPRPRKVASGRC